MFSLLAKAKGASRGTRSRPAPPSTGLAATASNQAMLSRLAGRPHADAPGDRERPSTGRRRLSAPALSSSLATVDPALAIAAVDDPLEHEASRIADEMAPVSSAVSSAVAARRSRSAVKVGGNLQRSLLRQHVRPGTVAGTGLQAPPLVHEVLRSAGQPLDASISACFGARLGRDLSGVRLHVDHAAGQSAREVGALAYTVGRHIAFAAGHFAPRTRAGRNLLAHELVHVAQQENGRPSLQRAPDPTRSDARGEAGPQGRKPPRPLPEFVQADLVTNLVRGKDDDWEMTISGFVDEERVARLIWPKWKPTYVTVALKVAVVDPVYLGIFTLDGVDFDSLKFMEPSFARLFAARGLEDESKESPEIVSARAAFMSRHDDLDDWILRTVDFALKRATRRNPDLLLAYYRYYATHDLDDEDMSLLGETVSGNTSINSDALRLESRFRTSDPVSLLGGTLIHEFVHTPHGGADTVVGMAPKEAKAYGIEVFFSERMKDTEREEVIYNRYRSNDPVTLRTNSNKIFLESHYIMTQLYKIIDQGGPAAAQARRMSVEFISKNETDYGADLRVFIAKHRR